MKNTKSSGLIKSMNALQLKQSLNISNHNKQNELIKTNLKHNTHQNYNYSKLSVHKSLNVKQKNTSYTNFTIINQLNNSISKQNKLNINSSVINIVINNVDKKISQETSSIFDYSIMKDSHQNRLKKELFLQSLLFSDHKQTQSQSVNRQDSDDDSQQLLLSNKCCGCMDMQIIKQINTPLKKKWNKYYSEIIFDYFFHEKTYYSKLQLKEKVRRFFLINNLSFRLQDIDAFIKQIFKQDNQTICFRKFGIFLQNFTQSNQNPLYKLWIRFNTEYLSFNEIKILISSDIQNDLKDKLVKNLEKYVNDQDRLRISLNNSEWFNYWDLYLIKQVESCNMFINLMEQFFNR